MRAFVAIALALAGSSVLAEPERTVCGPRGIAARLSPEAFVECARTATGKYRDQSAAILDGYRRIGRDFPAMGEHWIRVASVFDGQFDPARPEVLQYLVVDGTPRLLGVAYAVPLLAGESAPDWPVGKDAWHDHFRTIEDETVLPLHHAHGRTGDVARLAMLHAWIWAPNPAGMFAADNWSIPYLRLGMPPPPTGPESAAKALSLATGATDYFMMAIEASVPLTERDRTAIRAGFRRATADVESASAGRTGAALTDDELRRLGEIWTALWQALDTSVSAGARQPLLRLTMRVGRIVSERGRDREQISVPESIARASPEGLRYTKRGSGQLVAQAFRPATAVWLAGQRPTTCCGIERIFFTGSSGGPFSVRPGDAAIRTRPITLPRIWAASDRSPPSRRHRAGRATP